MTCKPNLRTRGQDKGHQRREKTLHTKKEHQASMEHGRMPLRPKGGSGLWRRKTIERVPLLREKDSISGKKNG